MQMAGFRVALTATVIVAVGSVSPPSGAAAPPTASLARAEGWPSGLMQDVTKGSCSVRAQLPDRAPVETGCGSGLAPVSEGSTAGALSLSARAAIQTPRGSAALAPLASTDPESFVAVHRLGDVAAYDSDGALIWSRPSMTFYDDWGTTPVGAVPRVALRYVTDPFAPETLPLNAETIQSERPFATGDLTGDGVDEVAVGHRGVLETDEDGNIVQSTGAITVLDGRDGTTLWHQRYPGYVTQVLIEGDVLVVGNVTGPPSGGAGEPGTTSRLDGLRVGSEDASLSVTTMWTVETGTAWARWLSVTPAGEGRLAAAWSRARSGDPGHVLLLDAETGATLWDRSTAGLPRTLRYDPTRDQVVLHEQASGSPASFTVTGLRAADGGAERTISRPAGALAALEVADVSGTAEAEWVLGYVWVTAIGAQAPTVVEAVDPATGATLWSQTRGSRAGPSPVPNRILVIPTGAGPQVAVGSLVIDYGKAPVRLTFELRAYDGETGSVAWTRQGDPFRGDDPLDPALLSVHHVAGRPVVLGTTYRLAIRGYDAVDGTPWLQAPTLAEPMGVHPVELNGDDMTDLLVGTEGGGIFALDGAELDDTPGILWSAATGGPVRGLEVADLDGDGRDEIVAAVTNGVEVLRIEDGRLRYRIDYPEGDYVFSVGVGDVTGDERPDLVVPTRTLATYRGTNGQLLWEFPPVRDDATATYFSNAQVTADGDVAVQFIEHSAWRTPSSVNTLLAGPYVQRHFLTVLDGPSGIPAWLRPTDSADQPTYLPRWRAVVPGVTPVGSTVFTYERQAQFPALSGGWHPGLYAHDVSSGDESWRGRATTGFVHMGTVPRGDGALELNWTGLLGADPDHTWEVDVGATSDVADADFGPLGRAFLTNWDGNVHVFAPDAAETGGTPLLLAQRVEDLTAGRMLAADLDGDGIDEIVTFGFDWAGYTEISATSGTLVIRLDATPHGIEVLEAEGG